MRSRRLYSASCYRCTCYCHLDAVSVCENLSNYKLCGRSVTCALLRSPPAPLALALASLSAIHHPNVEEILSKQSNRPILSITILIRSQSSRRRHHHQQQRNSKTSLSISTITPALQVIAAPYANPELQPSTPHPGQIVLDPLNHGSSRPLPHLAPYGLDGSSLGGRHPSSSPLDLRRLPLP